MSDSSDDDVSGFISPSSIRPSMRRDVVGRSCVVVHARLHWLQPNLVCLMKGMGSARQSTIVKAAARRQLRGEG